MCFRNMIVNVQFHSIVPSADCPSGTHSSAGECILCLQGTFQEENGQSTCKQCPKGQTTKYEGSQSPSDCIGIYFILLV